MTEVHRQPITDPSAWTPADLADDPGWELELDRTGAEDLLGALASIKARGMPLAEIGPADFPLPRCQSLLTQIREQLSTGRGFALLHGFPVQDLPREDIERLYWGFCRHLGMGMSQNSDGDLIHYVTEGRLRPRQGTRGVGNPGTVSLHVDLADCVSLLCVRQAKDSPRSRLASTTTLHNLLLERAPQALERLYEGFVWDRQNEHDPRESPTTGYRVPMFSARDGAVSCRYNRNWIHRALLRDGADFSPEDAALLDLVDELTHAHCLEFDFGPGDVQFANNYLVLHGRAPHAPATSEADTRLLMRIWLNLEGLGPWTDEAIVRHGVIRHGRLGWSADQVAGGLEGRLHARRPADGAPVVG